MPTSGFNQGQECPEEQQGPREGQCLQSLWYEQWNTPVFHSHLAVPMPPWLFQPECRQPGVPTPGSSAQFCAQPKLAMEKCQKAACSPSCWEHTLGGRLLPALAILSPEVMVVKGPWPWLQEG